VGFLEPDERYRGGDGRVDLRMAKKISKFDIDLGKLFDESFPDFKCMRCGNGTFFIFSDMKEKIMEDLKEKVSSEFGHKKEILEAIDIKSWSLIAESTLDELFVEVICRRCGHSERHFIPALINADKPIINDDRGRDD
jgi:ribosomal protein L37E